MAWIIRNQMARRNISKYDRCKLVMKLEPLYAKMAKERQREAGKKYGKGHPKEKEGRKVLLEIIKPKDTKLELAKLAGVSKTFYQQVDYIQKHATEKTKEMLERGTMTVNRAATTTQKEQAKKQAKEEVKEQKNKGEPPKRDAWSNARRKASFAVSNLKFACEEFDAIYAEHGSFAFKTHREEITQYYHSVKKSFNKLETLVEKISKDEDEIEFDMSQDEVKIPKDKVKKVLKLMK